MSSKIYHVDSDCDGEVDFDFFDSPRGPSTSTDLLKDPKHDSKNTKSDRDDSDSLSGSAGSGSGPETRANVKKIEAKVPTLTTESHDYSDSFDSYSENDESDNEVIKSEPKSECKPKGSRVSQKKAWGVTESTKSSSKSQNHSRSKSNGKTKPPTKSKSHKTSPLMSDNSSDVSISDTDSDVTEVSPLGSPRRHGRNMYDMRELAKLGKPPRSPMHKETVSYSKSKRPSSAKSEDGDKLEKLLNADSDSMDLQLLMQAVLEMEDDREKRQLKQRRVLFAPAPKPKPQTKLNQTFSNDKVRTIDQENQRLMKKIMTMAKEAEAAKTKKKPKCPPKEPPKLTPSAVNRLSEQRRIERENLAMLKRLQSTRATKDLQRNKLLTTYNSTLIAGQSLAAARPQSSKLGSPYESHSTGSLPEAGRRTRPSSAKSSASTVSVHSTHSSSKRPQSGKRAALQRPAWESGW